MPQRPRQHVIEDLARSAAHKAFAAVGWTSVDLAKDYGEDILVRIFDGGKASPWSFFVQSKATDRFERLMSKDGQHVTFRITSEHARHWTQFWEPVVLTIFDAKKDVTYWEVIQTHLGRVKPLLSDDPRGSITVHVPTDNILDEEGIRRLRNRTKARFQRFGAQKEGARTIIEELHKKWGVKIEYGPEFGILILPKGKFCPDRSGKSDVVAFGQFAAQLTRFQDKYGLKPQQAIDKALDVMYEIVTAMFGGSSLQVRNKGGSVRQEWHSLKELMRYIRRIELEDE